MYLKVKYWDDERSCTGNKWFNSMKDAMLYIDDLKKINKITSIILTQTLYEFER